VGTILFFGNEMTDYVVITSDLSDIGRIKRATGKSFFGLLLADGYRLRDQHMNTWLLDEDKFYTDEMFEKALLNSRGQKVDRIILVIAEPQRAQRLFEFARSIHMADCVYTIRTDQVR
jgi:hypothetical protein